MNLLDEIILFFFQKSKFYHYSEIEQKNHNVEKKIKWAFRKQFQWRFEEYDKNIFFFPEIKSYFKLLFWDKNKSIMSLKNIYNLSQENYIFAIYFNNLDFELKMVNLPLIKSAYWINYQSNNITGSVKWNNIELFLMNPKNSDIYSNDENNIYNIWNTLSLFDINKELNRIYQYKESIIDSWNEKIKNEIYILRSESIKEFASYIHYKLNNLPSYFINLFLTLSETMKRDMAEYVITLLSNDIDIKRAIDNYRITKTIPFYEYKNKMNIRRDEWNTDIHFTFNWYGDISNFLSESKNASKLTYIIHIKALPNQNIFLEIEWLYSKEKKIF